MKWIISILILAVFMIQGPVRFLEKVDDSKIEVVREKLCADKVKRMTSGALVVTLQNGRTVTLNDWSSYSEVESCE